jgi:hypothetical protein
MDYRRRLWLGILLCLSGMLAACGGGGGNSVPAGTFTLSTTSVSFSGKRLGPTPATQNVLVHLTGSNIATVGAGYASGVTAPTWLTVSYTGTAPDFAFTLAVNTTAMTSGNYSTTLTFGTADSNNNILQTQAVQVAYSLRDGLVIDATSVSTSLTVGDSVASENLPFIVSAPSTINWTARSDSPWLAAPSGTQQGPGNFSAAINMAGLGAGNYTGKITLTNTADPTDTASIGVLITMVAPAMTVTPSSINLGGAAGLDVSAQTLTFSINTNRNAYAWTATPTTASGGSWLNLSASSGMVSGSNSTLSVNASRSQLAAGTYTGQIQLQTTVNGSVLTQNIPVKLNVDPNRLIVNATGVAFSSFPSRAVLTRTLGVANTWGVTGVHWQAQSAQTWLTVTPGGTTGAPLVLTANPTGLAAGQYTAQVVITSPDTGVSNQETVRVGLTVGSTDPAALLTLPSVSAIVVATSPVEPVAFVTTGATNAPIYVYDLNTGTLLNTFTSGFTNPGELAISGDGLTLYVADNTAGGWAIRALDAIKGTLQGSYPFPSNYSTLPTQPGRPQLAYARPDTHPVLLCPFTSEAFDLVSGATYSISNSLGGLLAVSPDQTILYQMSTELAPAQISASSIVYSTLSGVGLITTRVAQYDGTSSVALSNGQDIAVSRDGTTVYTASGAPYEFEVFNTSLVRQSPLAGEAYPNNIATSWNGLIAAGADLADSAGDIWIYDSKGNLLTRMSSDPTTASHALAVHTLRFSGDGTRLTSMGLNGAGLEIHATPVPPP